MFYFFAFFHGEAFRYVWLVFLTGSFSGIKIDIILLAASVKLDCFSDALTIDLDCESE